MESSYAGILVIIAAITIYAIILTVKKRLSLHNSFSNQPHAVRLRTVLTNSIEEDGLTHLNAGCSDDGAAASASALMVARLAELLTRRNAFSEEPLLVSSNSSMLNSVSRESANNGMQKAGMANDFDPDSAVYNGFSPLSHQAGMISVFNETPASIHLNVGGFGAESALQSLAFSGEERIVTAGDDLTSQAAGMTVADDTLFGEQMYEIPAMLENSAQLNSALISMDVLRILLLAVMLFGALVGVLG